MSFAVATRPSRTDAASAWRRRYASGCRASRYIAHESAFAVVSCPARKIVMTSSRTCASFIPSPVPSSWAARSIERRSPLSALLARRSRMIRRMTRSRVVIAARTSGLRDADPSRNEIGVDIRALIERTSTETAEPTSSADSPTSVSSSVLLTISSVRRIISAATSMGAPSAQPAWARSAYAAIVSAYPAMRLYASAGAMSFRCRPGNAPSLVSSPFPMIGRKKRKVVPFAKLSACVTRTSCTRSGDDTTTTVPPAIGISQIPPRIAPAVRIKPRRSRASARTFPRMGAPTCPQSGRPRPRRP